jgi:hypothetical protein
MARRKFYPSKTFPNRRSKFVPANIAAGLVPDAGGDATETATVNENCTIWGTRALGGLMPCKCFIPNTDAKSADSISMPTPPTWLLRAVTIPIG